MNVLELNEVQKRFGRTRVLNGVTFRVPAGSVCGLVGPNGAGKTTTIQILLDLLRADDGEVHVLGLNPSRSSLELRRRIGYVPQKQSIYDWMTAQQALRFVAQLYPTWDWQEVERSNAVLQIPMTRKIRVLSGGEQAKLSLLMALAHRPAMLILDEPTAEFDPLVRRDFVDAIAELVHQHGRTVLFSTHVLSDIDNLADQIVLIVDGSVKASDSPAALRSRFTKASFLFSTAPAPDLTIPMARRVQRGQRECIAVFDAVPHDRILETAREIGASDCVLERVSLDDVFLELVERKSPPL